MLKKLFPIALGGLLSLCFATPSLAAVESANYRRAENARCSAVHEVGGVWRPSKGPINLSGKGFFTMELYGNGIDLLDPSQFQLKGQISGTLSFDGAHSGPDNAVAGCGAIGSSVVVLKLDGSPTRQTGSLKVGSEEIPLTLIPGYINRLEWSSDNEPREASQSPVSNLTEAQKRAHDAPIIAEAVRTCLTNMANRSSPSSSGVSYSYGPQSDCRSGTGYYLFSSAQDACTQIQAYGYSCSTAFNFGTGGSHRVSTLGACLARNGGSAYLSGDTLTLIVPARSTNTSLGTCFTKPSFMAFDALPTLGSSVHFVGRSTPVIGVQIDRTPGAPALSYDQQTGEDEGGFLSFAPASLREVVGVHTYTLRPSGTGSRPLTLILMSDPANAVKALDAPLTGAARFSSIARFKATPFQAVRAGQLFEVSLLTSEASSCFEQPVVQVSPPAGVTSFDVDFKFTESAGCVGKSASFVAKASGYDALPATATFTIVPLDTPRNLPPSSSVTKVRNSALNQN